MTPAKKTTLSLMLRKALRLVMAFGFSMAITRSQIMFEVLDKTDGKFTKQVNRIALELADDLMARTA